MKHFLRKAALFCGMVFFDPLVMLRKCLGLPYFIRNWRSYKQAQVEQSFPIKWRDIYYSSHDRFASIGQGGHYFFLDLWAARKVYELSRDSGGGYKHVDVGSRLDGFVAHLLPHCKVIYVDIRPLPIAVEGLKFIEGSILRLPLENDSCETLSCLHVIEHIGLGRYGDDVDPYGHMKAARELMRVLKPGGILLIGTPVGRERLCFDAHRIFDPETMLEMFAELELVEFSLVDDTGDKVIRNASMEQARKCEYGCGLFHFLKPLPPVSNHRVI
jgi:SAM-dependent methyltransferase